MPPLPLLTTTITPKIQKTNKNQLRPLPPPCLPPPSFIEKTNQNRSGKLMRRILRKVAAAGKDVNLEVRLRGWWRWGGVDSSVVQI